MTDSTITDLTMANSNAMKKNSDKIDSTMLRLKTLETEYELTMKKYEETYKTYINSLSANDSSKIEYKYINGSTYWGTAGLEEKPLTTQEECSALCSSNSQCTGATFNPDKRYCWTRTGEGEVTAGQDADVAIIQKSRSILTQLKFLNTKLVNLNSEIKTALNELQTPALEEMNAKNEKKTYLNKLSSKLEKERAQLTKMMNEYATVNESYEETNLLATQKNVQFRYWLLLASIVFLITLKKMVNPKSASLNFIFWLLLFILLLIFSYTLTTPQGYLMWLFVVLIMVLVKLNIIPSPGVSSKTSE
uniref:Apple domain-containing protein n=1 Tax=viral metagenome TaxID=1070528 RepID=A0A6C0F3R9_9ZZZZ